MGKMFVGSIDLSKIDKSKIVTKDKNGKPFENGAKYYSVVVWVNDETDQYGNIGSIQESVSKEDRESGVKGVYLGNFKNVSGQNVSISSGEKPSSGNNGDGDDFPF